MPQPKAVIFDIGNVLIEWNPERYFDRVIGREQRERMFAEAAGWGAEYAVCDCRKRR